MGTARAVFQVENAFQPPCLVLDPCNVRKLLRTFFRPLSLADSEFPESLRQAEKPVVQVVHQKRDSFQNAAC